MRRAITCFLVVLSSCARPAAPPAKVAPPAVAKETVPSFGAESIDAALRATWKEKRIVPAPAVDDAAFLRRVTIDVAGTVPRAETVERFLADPSPDKRKRVVDELLASKEYAEHWATYWDDVLMGGRGKKNLVDEDAFRGWLAARFAENAPWDRVVRDLVAATGDNENEPAVNFTLRFVDSPQDLAGNASRIFLGAQIQCAQCHDHKTESWKQDDFRKFASAFLHAKVEPLEPKEKGMTRRVQLVDANRVAPRFAKMADLAPIAKARPTALDGTDLDRGDGTRKALAAWMTSAKNPWFARAIVNRMWGHYMGRGFFDPVDDMRASNAPELPALLDRIADEFAAHGFDLAWLTRVLCATEAYSLAPAAAAEADPENKLWSRFHLTPLGSEELMNAIFRVTDVERAAEKSGVKNLDQLRANVARQYVFLFDVDEEDDTPDYAGNVSQALALLNGALVAQGSRALPASALAEAASGDGTDAQKIERIVLRVLGRKPTPAELERWTAYVAAPPAPSATAKKPLGGPFDRLANKKSDPKLAAYEDLFWAMLNSSEFVFNH